MIYWIIFSTSVIAIILLWFCVDDVDIVVPFALLLAVLGFFMLIFGISYSVDSSACNTIGELTGKKTSYSVSTGCLVQENEGSNGWVEIETPTRYFDKK